MIRTDVISLIKKGRYAGTIPDLQGVDLSGVDLRNVDLRGADLTGANLSRANLSGARYDQKTVWPVNFRPAEMGAICED